MRQFHGGKNVLPGPLFRRGGIYSAERIGKVNFAVALFEIFFVEDSDAGQVFAQRWTQCLREHRDAIFVTLAIPNDDLGASEVDVFDAKAQTFHEPNARAVKEFAHELGGSGHGGEHALDFRLAQDDRDSPGATRTDEIIHPIEVDVENFGIEEDEGIERLVLSGSGDVLVEREIRKERLNFGSAHFAGMTFLVEEDITYDPANVGVFRVDRVVLHAENFADLVEEFGFGIGDDLGLRKRRFSSAARTVGESVRSNCGGRIQILR